MVLSGKHIDCLAWVGDVSFLQVKEFQYLQVLFMNAGMMELKVSVAAPNQDEVRAEPEGSRFTNQSLSMVMSDGSRLKEQGLGYKQLEWVFSAGWLGPSLETGYVVWIQCIMHLYNTLQMQSPSVTTAFFMIWEVEHLQAKSVVYLYL